MFWYNDDINRLEKLRQEITDEPETLFYGSSSIRLWQTLATDLPELKPLNLGFGGSTLAACTWFFDRVMAGYIPKRLVIYAGDNDLGDGRHPEEVFLFFREFSTKVQKRFGDIPCYFISLKPSISRWGIANQFHFTNHIIGQEIQANLPNWQLIDIFSAMLNEAGHPNWDYYVHDGLHLNKKGYALWTQVVKNAIII